MFKADWVNGLPVLIEPGKLLDDKKHLVALTLSKINQAAVRESARIGLVTHRVHNLLLLLPSGS